MKLEKEVKKPEDYIEILREVLKDYDACAIDCFPLLIKNKITPCLALSILNKEKPIACEADLDSLLLLMVSFKLGIPGFIFNVVDSNEFLIGAHCTICQDLLEEVKFKNHYESGYPLAVYGKLKYKKGLIATIKGRTVYYKEVEIVESGNFLEENCAMQVKIKPSIPLEKIKKNHHVLTFVDKNLFLKSLKMLGLRIKEY